MKKTAMTLAFALAVLCSAHCEATQKAAYVWNQLADGLLYTDYSFAIGENSRAEIYAFMVDPAKYRFGIATAADEQEGATAREMAKKAKALLAINGGFFTPEHKSIGLIVKDGRSRNPIHNTSWWSIFYVRGGVPGISPPKGFAVTDDMSMALQVGPRLVVDGSIPKLKEGFSARSAVGIDGNGNVIVAITTGGGISLRELAKRMSQSRWMGGLECRNAMALDGGGSSQLYAKVGRFELALDGIARVTNGLVVLPLPKK